MNHLLFGFALCAALAIYPGGVAVLVASVAAGAPELLPRGVGWKPRRMADAVRRPWSSVLGLALAGLVLAPMPWPDNPVAPVGISWASGSNLGGIALSLSGLWALSLQVSNRPRRGGVLALLGAWSLGLVLLALVVHSGSWLGVLTARGLGAELGRVLLAVLGLFLLPWALEGPPGGASIRGCGWAAGAGVALLMALPQLQGAPFPLVLVAWWALLVVLGLAWAAGTTWGPGKLRRPATSPAAATLNVP